MKIIICCDGSASSLAAAYLASHFTSRKDQVHFFSCYTKLLCCSASQTNVNMGYLQKARRFFAGKIDRKSLVQCIEPASDVQAAIANYIKKNEIDFAFMGSKISGDVKGIVVGSASQHVLEKCHNCTLVVVREHEALHVPDTSNPPTTMMNIPFQPVTQAEVDAAPAVTENPSLAPNPNGVITGATPAAFTGMQAYVDSKKSNTAEGTSEPEDKTEQPDEKEEHPHAKYTRREALPRLPLHFFVCSDGSEASIRAAETVASVVKEDNPITIYAAETEPEQMVKDGNPVIVPHAPPVYKLIENPKYDAELQIKAEKVQGVIQTTVAKMQDKNELVSSHQLLNRMPRVTNDVQADILKSATESNAHIVVMGASSKGDSVISRILMAESTGNYVMNHCTSPAMMFVH